MGKRAEFGCHGWTLFGAFKIVDRAAVGRPISDISRRNSTNLNLLVSGGLWATQSCFSLDNSLPACAKRKLCVEIRQFPPINATKDTINTII